MREAAPRSRRNIKSRPSWKLARLGSYTRALGCVALGSLACGGDADSRTLRQADAAPWFGSCTSDQGCAEGQCLCGICSVACVTSDCAVGAPNGVCVGPDHPAHGRLCAGREAPALCLSGCEVDADCASGLQCLDGVCLASEAVAIVRSSEPAPARLCAADPVVLRSVKISSQAGIDALAGCERIVGDLQVEAFPGADVRPLRSLREVTGAIQISDALDPRASDPLESVRSIESSASLSLTTLELTSLEPLARLRVEDQVWITDCRGLTTLDGVASFGAKSLYLSGVMDLASLSGLGAMRLAVLRIQRTSIVNLAGLEQVSGLTELDLSSNPELSSLVGLADTSQLASLSVGYNPKLVALDAPPLPSHMQLIRLDSNPLLARLSSLEGLTTAGTIGLSGNAALVNLEAFRGLLEVEYFSVSDSPALASLAGLESLSRATSLELSGDRALVDLTGLRALAEVGMLDVSGDPQGLDPSHPPLLASLAGVGALRRVDRLVLRGNSALSSLVGLGSAEIGTLELENSALRDLTGLEQVTGLRNLMLVNNARLTSLVGYAPPNEVNDVGVDGSPSLTDISALRGVVSASSGIHLRNTGVVDVNGLQALRSALSIALVDNVDLIQVDALAGLENVNELIITDNPSLRALPSFASLVAPSFNSLPASPGFLFLMSRNASLRAVSGFPALESASEISVYANPLLLTLDGFTALQSVGVLAIEENASLVSANFAALESVSRWLMVGGNPGLNSAQLARFAEIGSEGRTEVSGAQLDPCPWSGDAVCDEAYGACAPNTDPDCR